MGFGGISLTQLLVIFAIVLVVFGTRRLSSLGSDLGGAIKGFRKAMDADDDTSKGHGHDAERQGRIESDKDAGADAVSSRHTAQSTAD